MRDKLECARDMLRHAVPDGNPAEIFDRALTTLLHELARKKFAATDRPRPVRGSKERSRYIPSKVKREVWVRDSGRCTFVASDGRRCDERGFVQFHHDIRFADGGPATAANVALICGPHNRHLEDVYQGRAAPAPVVREAAGEYESASRDITGSGPSCVPGTQGCAIFRRPRRPGARAARTTRPVAGSPRRGAPSRRSRGATTIAKPRPCCARRGYAGELPQKKTPRTSRYDSSLSPALAWDGQNSAREMAVADALIEEASRPEPPHEFPQPRRTTVAGRWLPTTTRPTRWPARR
jgi:hypothetical protein